MALNQRLQFKLSQKLSPQQIQLMKMIQMPTQAFEQRLKQEIEENPALESGAEESETSEDTYADTESEGEVIEAEDINIDEYLSDDEIPSYKIQSNNYSADDEDARVPYAAGTTFHQTLLNQLRTFELSEEELQITEFLVGSLDDGGYLRREIYDVVDDLAFTQNIYTTKEQVQVLLTTVIQQLEPIGVGACDLRECLLLQLKHKKAKLSIKLAIEILDQSFEHFVKKHYNKLLLKFDVTKTQLREAFEEISKLNPKPGSAVAETSKITEQVVPDFTIKIVEDQLELSLNARNVPTLHVSKEYGDMLKGYQEATRKSKAQKDTVLFIKQKLDGAKWFIDAIKQRQHTLIATMNAIVDYQRDYFLTGDERKLKPMILKNIADVTRLDVSTISRVANSKYVSTPYGTMLIKTFFSESIKNEDGADISTREIKKTLETIIQEEDKRNPLSDDKLSELLKEKGYPLARRTVAKYREQLGVSVARLRKEI